MFPLKPYLWWLAGARALALLTLAVLAVPKVWVATGRVSVVRNGTPLFVGRAYRHLTGDQVLVTTDRPLYYGTYLIRLTDHQVLSPSYSQNVFEMGPVAFVAYPVGVEVRKDNAKTEWNPEVHRKPHALTLRPLLHPETMTVPL